jgi:hypothetical protein
MGAPSLEDPAMRFPTAVLLVAGALAVPPAHAEPAETLPAAVATNLASIAAMCREAEGTPHTAEAVRRADLNADGREDFVLFTGWVHCEGAASLYGDREKAIAVYAGDAAGGATETFSDAVFDARIEGATSAPELWLTLSGQGCGKPPAPDFAHENFCDRKLVWNAGSKKFDYAPVSTVRMIE